MFLRSCDFSTLSRRFIVLLRYVFLSDVRFENSAAAQDKFSLISRGLVYSSLFSVERRHGASVQFQHGCRSIEFQELSCPETRPDACNAESPTTPQKKIRSLL